MKKQILFVLIAMLVFLYGCSSTEVKKSEGPYVGGTNGLLFYWTSPTLENNILFDQGASSLPLVLSIKNDGEYTINTEGNNQKIKITLDGVHYSDIHYEGIENSLTKNIDGEELIGKRKNLDGTVYDGLSTYVEFNDFKFLRKVSGETVRPIRAKICYPYQTFTTAKICVAENLALPPKDSLCEVNGPAEVFSSSGPLQVTSLRQGVLRNNSIEIVFKIEHKSTGEFFAGENCEATFANKDVVNVYIGDKYDPFWNKLVCRNLNNPITGSLISIVPLEPYVEQGNRVRLNMGQATVSCEIVLDPQDLGSYYKDLPITLKYSYQDDATTSLLIRPSGDE